MSTERSLRVLVVCRSLPVHRTGGMESHTLGVIEGLRAAGHDVHVLTTPAESHATNVHAVGEGRKGHYSFRFFRRLAKEAKRLCCDLQIDVIHAQGFSGIPLTFAQKDLPPVVTTVHGTLWSETPLDRRLRRTRSFSERLGDLWRFKHRLVFVPYWRAWLSRRPRVICDSRFTARELRREQRGLRPVVVPLGFETGSFSAEAGRLQDDVFLCLCVGRIERIKGFDFLLRVAKELQRRDGSRFQLVIGGDGPDRQRIERKVEAMGLGRVVSCLGRIDDDDLPRWLRDADVFLNADGGYPAFGLANAEALAAGTPVIATPNGAHKEVVLHDEDGKLLDARDPARWANAVRQMSHLDRRFPARRDARRARAERRFSGQRMIMRLERVYRRVIAETAIRAR